MNILQKHRSLVLPLAIVLGFLFHAYLAKWIGAVPYLLFGMLLLAYAGISLRDIRITRMDIILLAFQLLFGIGVFVLIKNIDDVVAQGMLVAVLCPTATSATVVAVLLGAKTETMLTYTLFSNLTLALLMPLCFMSMDIIQGLSLWQTCWAILGKVVPMLLFPFLVAMLIKYRFPKVNTTLVAHKGDSLYLWAVSLTLVLGSTFNSILEQPQTNLPRLWGMLAGALFVCAVQFAVGKYVGWRFGEKIAGGQAVGQKNTAIAIWMAQTFLNPVASVVPAAYSVWQNLFNSYQLWRKEKREK